MPLLEQPVAQLVERRRVARDLVIARQEQASSLAVLCLRLGMPSRAPVTLPPPHCDVRVAMVHRQGAAELCRPTPEESSRHLRNLTMAGEAYTAGKIDFLELSLQDAAAGVDEPIG
jgi:hypothetical protein